jgi:hypothetical protein
MAVSSRQPRSDVVDSLAWSFLIFGVACALLNLVQWIWIQLTISSADMAMVVREMRSARTLPSWLLWMLEHVHVWLAALFAASTLTALAAWALLKRYEWARLTWVVMLWLGAAANLAGAVLPFLPSTEPGLIESLKPLLQPEWAAWLSASSTGSAWTIAGCAVAFAVLFGWSAWCLGSPAIRAEFAAPANSTA